MSLIILIGLGAAVIYLLRLVSTLQDRVNSLERNLDLLSLRLNRPEKRVVEPPPLPVSMAPSAPPAMASPPAIPSMEALPVPPPVQASEPLLQEQEERVSPPPLPSPEPATPEKPFNWEQFLGAKLFAWVGGLALFVGIAFFVKYSFDRNLIPPWLRVALGFVMGMGLVIAGIMTRRKEYLITAQTFVATGVVVLYSVSFIARSLYGLINTPVLFFLMTGITVAAFTLAIRLDARVVAVLGMLGGFLTPQLVSGTRDQPLVLFGYVLVLNCGLLAAARRCNWGFLIPLAAGATFLTETAWVLTNLRPENLYIALLMFGAVTALFVANARINPDPKDEQPRALFAGVLQSLLVFGVAFWIHVNPEWGVHPVVFLSTLFFGNFALLALYGITLTALPLIFGVSATGGLLALWIGSGPNPLAACIAALVFALFNALLPSWIAHFRSAARIWPNIASVAGLGLLLLVLFRDSNPGWFFWPVVLGLNAVLLAVALLRRSLWLAVCGTLGTALLSLYWIVNLATDHSPVQPLIIVGVFSLLYFFLGGAVTRRTEDPQAAYFPVIPAGIPYLLIALLMVRLKIESPSLLFSFALLLSALLIFASPRTSAGFPAVGLVGTLLLQFVWFGNGLTSSNALVTLAWYIGFSLAFTFFPLLTHRRGPDDWLQWYASAAAGPAHFFLVYSAAKLYWPDMSLPGLVPALLGIPAAVMFLFTRGSAPDKEAFLRFTAIYGASLAFFITLIFPIQFDRQWLTIGWALEGAALLWLNRRAPAEWLVVLASILLMISFGRLGLNLSVFQYQQRSEIPLLNWYLYAYGIVSVCLFAAARLCHGIQNGPQLKAAFSAMGTILLFLLMNIEIADFFADGPYLTFEFSGNFARDMTYSIAWSMFALTLILAGVKRDVPAVRYAGLALMGITLLKLFLHDLTRLDALFRIGAFVGVAIILIFASWMYQRFLISSRGSNPPHPPA